MAANVIWPRLLFVPDTYHSHSLELALGRISCVHQRWRAGTDLPQESTAIRDGKSLSCYNIDTLERFLQQDIAALLAAEIAVSKDDTQAVSAMIQPYSQLFLIDK